MLLPFTAVPLYVLPALVSVKVPPPLTFRLPAWPMMPFRVASCPAEMLTVAAPPRLTFCPNAPVAVTARVVALASERSPLPRFAPDETLSVPPATVVPPA